jgi:ribonucleoside-triphosphate reductase
MVAWDGINISFAPPGGMSDREIRQFAQMLVYEFSQLTAGRGGQAMFTDIHLYWAVPPHFKGAESRRAGWKGEFRELC